MIRCKILPNSRISAGTLESAAIFCADLKDPLPASPIRKSTNGGGEQQYPGYNKLFSSKPLFPFPQTCSSVWGKDGMGV